VPGDLPEIVAFYSKVLRLTPGARPAMPRPGYWLYSEGQPIVHLYASLDERVEGPTGALDHISFRTHGLAEPRALLKDEGIVYDEFPLPGTEIHQIFLKDPMGLKIELTFDLAEEKSDA
jgi:catechol 2,3-dioxygenase-like lactoylglutathione lyase family enzyme